MKRHRSALGGGNPALPGARKNGLASARTTRRGGRAAAPSSMSRQNTSSLRSRWKHCDRGGFADGIGKDWYVAELGPPPLHAMSRVGESRTAYLPQILAAVPSVAEKAENVRVVARSGGTLRRAAASQFRAWIAKIQITAGKTPTELC